MTASPAGRLVLRIPAEPAAVSAAVRAIGAAAGVSGLAAGQRSRLELAVSETLTNIVRHAYAGRAGTIDVRVRVRAAEVQVRFRDDGLPMRALEIEAPAGADVGLEDLRESGRGLWIVRETVSHAAYRRVADRNIWTLVQRAA